MRAKEGWGLNAGDGKCGMRARRGDWNLWGEKKVKHRTQKREGKALWNFTGTCAVFEKGLR